MAVPAITLTDPNNHDTAPSPLQSPIKESSAPDLHTRQSSGRPGSPAAKNAPGARPESSSGWPSPGRLIRTISPNSSPLPGNTQKPEAVASAETPTTIDPLSQHILSRTNAPLNVPSNANRPRSPDGSTSAKDEKAPAEDDPAPPVQEPLSRTDTNDPAHKDLKKGVKAVAFLTRLMGTKKKDADEDAIDDESTTSEGRPEGTDAEVFAQPTADNVGFSPQQPQPPAYIKVRSKYKKKQEFDRVFLAQELHCYDKPKLERRESSNKLRRKSSANPPDGNTIWAMEFSRDGKYLAAAGADKIVRVWAVLTSPEDRQKHESQESGEGETSDNDRTAEHLSAPVFLQKPVREFEGHSSTILDLSWSKNNFLLSSSMDKTVRLWHVSRAQCLCTFKHSDFVPSIAFHPKDDRFFLAGSLDSKLRLWSIPDKNVAYSTQVPDMITAVGFTPDGKSAMAGCLSGLCMFYETENLKYQTQINVRSTRGQNAKGSKITGIQAQYGPSGDIKVLITSNDSRIRLYNFRDKSLELKFKGHENNYSQIRATLSDDGKNVICGSEDRKAYIWSLQLAQGERRDKIPVEMFEAHETITTVVCVAPTKTRQHLSMSEDPVYDLCNPPPVTLLSQAERAGSQNSSRAPTENGSIMAEGRFEKSEKSPSFLSRSTHKCGVILLTADFIGKIKVFRQDCGWAKRRPDDWDKSSLFTKRTSRASRTESLATRGSQRSLREGRSSTSTQGPSDRILSWRQGIASTSAVGEGGSKTPKHESRSRSPRKSLERRSLDRKSLDRRSKADAKLSSSPGDHRSTHPLAADVMVRSPSPTQGERDPISHESRAQDVTDHLRQENDPLALEGGERSYLFWDPRMWEARRRNLQSVRDRQVNEEYHATSPAISRTGSTGDGTGEEAGPTVDNGHLAVRPPLNTVPTYVSELSDERSSVEDEFDDAKEHDDNMRCITCGSLSFTGKRTKEGISLVCVKCGKPA